MSTTNRFLKPLALACLCGALGSAQLFAQITNVVFTDDFSKNGIDTNRYAIDAPFFEGGQGTIAPKVENGVLEFTGEVTQRWWAGATLRVLQPFPINPETNVLVTVDRVAENGTGTSTRSALWLMDGTRTKYVLYADNTLEGGWQYNRKLGITGDVPTGGGTDIAAFNGTDPNTGVDYDDLGKHQMSALFNGTDVKLYLDGVYGTTVSFPFDTVVIQLGSYARDGPPDPPDTAGTVWDNLAVSTIGAEAFSAGRLTLVSGQTSTNVTVRIPPGVNKTQAVQVQVTSSDPTIAIPVGAVAGSATVTFAAGAPFEQSLSIQSLGPAGGARLTLTNSIGMGTANSLDVVVSEGAGVRLTDDFTGATIDASKWVRSDQSFEAGAGTFDVTQTGGQLVMSGSLDQSQYWGGVSLKTVKGYTAIPDAPLSFEVDRVSIDPTGSDGATPSTGARTGVFITTADRSRYVLFAQNVGETGWEVNVNPGTPTGSGTALAAFSAITDNGNHRMKLVADGSTVEVFLDGKSGGKFPFAVSADIRFEVGAYARDLGDAVKGVFDNVKIENILPPITVATQLPNSVTTALGINTNLVIVTLPKFLNATKAAVVSVTSQDPKVAIPEGAVNGTLALQFAAGAPGVQSFKVIPVAVGATSFSFTNDQAAPMGISTLPVTVTSSMVPVFTDDFGTGLDTNKNWTVDTTPLDSATPGTLTADSSLSVTNGMLSESVIVDTGNWPGLNLKTSKSYSASQSEPVWFDVDRKKLDFKLVTGTGAQERAGVWIFDSTGNNYVFFNEYLTHSGTIQGWQYNRMIGQTDDLPVPGAGTLIGAFSPAAFNDQGNHHMQLVANGTDVKLFLDGVYGVSVPFPYKDGLTFALGTYVAAATDTADGYFDNVVISGPGTIPAASTISVARQAGGQVVITWTGTGTLQSAPSLPGTWTDVTPPPTGNTYSVAPSAKETYYRVRQ